MKANEVLRTRLLVPPVRQDLVPRPQLLARLDEILTKRLALVSAPAGYGKTTLLAAWARASGSLVAWLTLDEGDNDPARFVGYLCAALQTIPALAGEDLWETVRSAGSGQPGDGTALDATQTDLLNRLAAVPHGFVLVLDDYHLITAQAVQRFIGGFLEGLPPQAHLAIASRADPALPLPRLRARGQLVEIRLAQLRFTTAEAAALLRQIVGLGLGSAEIAEIAGRTEGWAAGLQMAALAMQGRGDLAAYVHDFAGSNRYVLDYLVEEVLDRQPAAVQDFLLATSILERMSAGLVHALLSPDGGDARLDLRACEETLEALERSNLFVIPLDDRREWYRYHHLFADLLVRRLHQERPGRAPILHARASRWFEDQGMSGEAIDHALLAGDAARAAELVERAAADVLMRGEVSTLLGWMRRLPPGDFVASRPRLDLYAVTALVLMGEDPAAIEAGIERIGRHPELAYAADVLAALGALASARLSTAEKLLQRGLAAAPEEATFFRSVAAWWLSTAESTGRGLDRRTEILEVVLGRARRLGNRMIVENGLCSLASIRMRQGRLAEARDLYREALQGATGPDGRHLPIAGEALIGLGNLLREWNQLDEAVRFIEEGIELIRRVRVPSAVEGLVVLAWCRQAQGDVGAARHALKEARQTSRLADGGDLDARMIDFYEALLLQRQGDNAPILRYFETGPSWKKAPDVDESDLSRIEAHLRKYERIAWARACLADGRPAQALREMDELLPPIADEGRLLMVAEIELLRSLALANLGRAAESQAAFEAALAAGEPGGLVRQFVDEGPAIVTLLQAAIRGGSHAAYAARLLDVLLPAGARRTDAEGNGHHGPALAGLAEPLSPRELEVLGWLASSLSAKEIAERLVVAESTVNSHTKSIYGKLGVRRRLDAIEKAKALGLL